MVALGLLKKVRLLRRNAPRNDTKRLFQVIASDSKNLAAILKCSFGTFSTAPLSPFIPLHQVENREDGTSE